MSLVELRVGKIWIPRQAITDSNFQIWIIYNRIHFNFILQDSNLWFESHTSIPTIIRDSDPIKRVSFESQILFCHNKPLENPSYLDPKLGIRNSNNVFPHHLDFWSESTFAGICLSLIKHPSKWVRYCLSWSVIFLNQKTILGEKCYQRLKKSSSFSFTIILMY